MTNDTARACRASSEMAAKGPTLASKEGHERMNYYSQDLVRSRMDDFRREAERMSKVNEAYRASKLRSARNERSSSWSTVKRFPARLAATLTGFAG